MYVYVHVCVYVCVFVYVCVYQRVQLTVKHTHTVYTLVQSFLPINNIIIVCEYVCAIKNIIFLFLSYHCYVQKYYYYFMYIVCMYRYMYICMFICMYVCMYICMYVHVYIKLVFLYNITHTTIIVGHISEFIVTMATATVPPTHCSTIIYMYFIALVLSPQRKSW